MEQWNIFRNVLCPVLAVLAVVFAFVGTSASQTGLHLRIPGTFIEFPANAFCSLVTVVCTLGRYCATRLVAGYATVMMSK